MKKTTEVWIPGNMKIGVDDAGVVIVSDSNGCTRFIDDVSYTKKPLKATILNDYAATAWPLQKVKISVWDIRA